MIHSSAPTPRMDTWLDLHHCRGPWNCVLHQVGRRLHWRPHQHDTLLLSSISSMLKMVLLTFHRAWALGTLSSSGTDDLGDAVSLLSSRSGYIGLGATTSSVPLVTRLWLIFYCGRFFSLRNNFGFLLLHICAWILLDLLLMDEQIALLLTSFCFYRSRRNSCSF